MTADFYEDDEPVEKIRAILERDPQGVSAFPAHWRSADGFVELHCGSLASVPTLGGHPMVAAGTTWSA